MSKKRPTNRRLAQKGVPEGPVRGAQQQQQQQHQQQQPDHADLLLHRVVSGGVRKGAALALERLKHSILARREAQGLQPLSPEQGEQRVKHELTPEEIEKKERRKEQNRRAARKCRLKKKLLQTDAAKGYESIAIENAELEREIQQLKAEKENLERMLNEHISSGLCRNVKLEKEEVAEILYEDPQILSPEILTAPTPSPQILPPLRALAPPALSPPTPPPQDFINLYLQAEPLNPLDTFEDFQDLSAIASDVVEGAGGVVVAFPTTGAATSAPLIPAAAAALATRACPTVLAGRSRENLELEALGAGQRCHTAYGDHQAPFPWSPAPTRDVQHERHASTSSVASDSSEASQGFQLVPVRGLRMAASSTEWFLGLGLEVSAEEKAHRGLDVNLNLLPALGPDSSEMDCFFGFGWQEAAEKQNSEDFYVLDAPRHWRVSHVDDEEVFDEEDLS